MALIHFFFRSSQQLGRVVVRSDVISFTAKKTGVEEVLMACSSSQTIIKCPTNP